MSVTSQGKPPRIEELLIEARHSLDVLMERRSTIARSGVDVDHLPDDSSLKAFALLGNHEREDLLDYVREHWPRLISRGLARGPISTSMTAELRLLAHVLPHCGDVADVWQRLESAEPKPEPPMGVLRCPVSIRGAWGRRVELHFVLQHCQHALIAPDPIFCLQPALVAADPSVRYAGKFEFPIERGVITISVMHRDGTVYRKLVEVWVEESA
jgi:hypothetical protein